MLSPHISQVVAHPFQNIRRCHSGCVDEMRTFFRFVSKIVELSTILMKVFLELEETSIQIHISFQLMIDFLPWITILLTDISIIHFLAITMSKIHFRPFNCILFSQILNFLSLNNIELLNQNTSNITETIKHPQYHSIKVHLQNHLQVAPSLPRYFKNKSNSIHCVLTEEHS